MKRKRPIQDQPAAGSSGQDRSTTGPELTPAFAAALAQARQVLGANHADGRMMQNAVLAQAQAQTPVSAALGKAVRALQAKKSAVAPKNLWRVKARGERLTGRVSAGIRHGRAGKP